MEFCSAMVTMSYSMRKCLPEYLSICTTCANWKRNSGTMGCVHVKQEESAVTSPSSWNRLRDEILIKTLILRLYIMCVCVVCATYYDIIILVSFLYNCPCTIFQGRPKEKQFLYEVCAWSLLYHWSEPFTLLYRLWPIRGMVLMWTNGTTLPGTATFWESPMIFNGGN